MWSQSLLRKPAGRLIFDDRFAAWPRVCLIGINALLQVWSDADTNWELNIHVDWFCEWATLRRQSVSWCLLLSFSQQWLQLLDMRVWEAMIGLCYGIFIVIVALDDGSCWEICCSWSCWDHYDPCYDTCLPWNGCWVFERALPAVLFLLRLAVGHWLFVGWNALLNSTMV